MKMFIFLFYEPQTVTPNSNGKLMKLHIIILRKCGAFQQSHIDLEDKFCLKIITPWITYFSKDVVEHSYSILQETIEQLV